MNFILELPSIFTPVIAKQIFGYLSYHEKRALSLTHRIFDFKINFQFNVVERYSCAISDWETFRDNTLLVIHSKIELVLHCFGLMESMQIFRILNLLSLYYDLINYVGCKPILAHLLFCNSLFEKGQKCLTCMRKICSIKKRSYILKQLALVSIDELLADAPDVLKNLFELMHGENIKSVSSLNCLIDHVKLNNSCISDKQQNFYDINPLGGNHLSLVFVNFLTVASRETGNYLYRNLTKKGHSGVLARPFEEPLHDVYVCLIITIVKVLCKQYIKHFYYQGFLKIFDKLSPKEVNDSFKVITNKRN